MLCFDLPRREKLGKGWEAVFGGRGPSRPCLVRAKAEIAGKREKAWLGDAGNRLGGCQVAWMEEQGPSQDLGVFWGGGVLGHRAEDICMPLALDPKPSESQVQVPCQGLHSCDGCSWCCTRSCFVSMVVPPMGTGSPADLVHAPCPHPQYPAWLLSLGEGGLREVGAVPVTSAMLCAVGVCCILATM